MLRFAASVLLAVLLAPAAFAQNPADLDAAEAALAQSDWKSAETKLDLYLAAHPDDARALFDAGYAADAANRPDDAAQLYRRACQADPQNFQARLSLGLLLARQNHTAEAHKELLSASLLNPGPEANPLKARAFRALAQIDRQSDPALASDELLQALKLSPETPDDALLAAQLAEATHQATEAQAAYRRVLAHNPQSAQANAGLAHLLIDSKKFSEAETLLRAALASTPDDPALSAQLALVLAEQDKAEALPLLEKLHAAHPQDDSITRMYAQVLNQAGESAASDKLYLQLLAAHPEDADLLAAHGDHLIRQLKFAEAYAALDKATQLDPKNADAWSGLAFAAARLGKHEATLHALTQRARYLPELPSTYFLWAAAYDALHQKSAAVTYYRHFLDAAAGKFPDQEWQARQRLKLLEK